MIRLRFRCSASIALFLALAVIRTGSAQTPPAKPIPSYQAPKPLPTVESLPPAASNSTERSYKIYSLGELGNDPGLCEWIASTIPEVIAIGTWGGRGTGKGTISYYAPKNILMVCHTSEVHAQVDGFLKDVKKSLSDGPKAKAAAQKNIDVPHEVVQTRYQVVLPSVANPAPTPTISYPVPAQTKPPKHLFHFIIRYEGEGIVDDNIVKAMKDYYRAEKQAAQTTSPAPAASGGLIGAGPSSPPASAPTPYSDDTAPATSKPPVKEKEEKKDDKGTEARYAR